MERNIKQVFVDRKVRFSTIVVILLLSVIAISLFSSNRSKNSQAAIINESSLKKIIDVSDLSTFQAVYNGITEVMDKNDEEKIAYYVSYEAKVKAGVDFEKVEIDVDDEKKIIMVEVPDIKINDVDVDITSLDYIFIDNSANTSTVSQEAYKRCIEDVNNESKNETAIYELAEENAHNIIEALISPFIKQLDNEYQLQIH